MGKVVVITGASGFVGSAVLRRISKVDGVRVLAVSRTPDPKGLLGAEVIGECLTRLSVDHWRSAGVKNIDALIHLAAYTPKGARDKDDSDAIVRSNIIGTHALLNSLPAAPGRVVFCSTLDVYSAQAFCGRLDETSTTEPASLYGASKLFGESMVKAYGERVGAEHVSLRLTHVYGPGEEKYKKLIPETIRRILSGRPPCLYGEGRERRDLLYVDDAAEAVIRATTARLGETRIINVASGASVQVKDVVHLISKETGYRGDIQCEPAAARPVSIEFDIALMHRILGDWPLIPLTEGLRREVRWFKDRQ